MGEFIFALHHCILYIGTGTGTGTGTETILDSIKVIPLGLKVTKDKNVNSQFRILWTSHSLDLDLGLSILEKNSLFIIFLGKFYSVFSDFPLL